jgi:hypothetical protein
MSDEAMVATGSREAGQLATRGDVERLSVELGVHCTRWVLRSRRAALTGCATWS